MKKRSFQIFLVLTILLAVPQICAISTIPPIFETTYTPKSYQEFQSQVWGVENLDVSFNSFLEERGEVLSISKDERGIYTVKWGFEMPDHLTPGAYDPLILFKEAPPPRTYGTPPPTMVSAVAAVGVPVKFYIPYPDKYLHLTGFEWDQEIGKGDILFFKAKLKSMGEKTIEKVSGTARIFGYDQEHKAPFTTAENVQLGNTIELLGEWAPPENLPLGNYKLVGEIDYDGTQLTTPEYYLTYGAKLIKILSLSPLEINTGKISLMELKVKNFWSEDLSFSVTTKAYDVNNSLMETTTSAETTVSRNSEGNVRFYLDAASWEEGNYTLEISLNYEGEPSFKTFEIKAITPVILPQEEKPSQINTILLVAVIILILIVLGFWFFEMFFKRKPSKIKNTRKSKIFGVPEKQSFSQDFWGSKNPKDFSEPLKKKSQSKRKK